MIISAEQARIKTEIAIKHKKASVLIYVFNQIHDDIKEGKYYTFILGLHLSEPDTRKLTNYGYNVTQTDTGVRISWSN